ncbi:MAG TPA: hypothetical protein PLX02_15235 [Syntrophorhabdaceae bacterium]|nr:hypothetical protein [Syntrophorhabdaceae bacterium]HQM82959.1 hypothetical protein [Syntrophorhabdaceae bacterium]
MITIRKIGARENDGNPDSPDTAGSYLVTENGREFTILYRSHSHGNSLSLYGEKGSLYTDSDTGTVHNQVVNLGGACGLSIDDTLVEGLSSLALRGVAFAARNNITGEIALTTEEHE